MASCSGKTPRERAVFLLGPDVGEGGGGGRRNERSAVLGDVLEFGGGSMGHGAMNPAGIETDLVCILIPTLAA